MNPEQLLRKKIRETTQKRPFENPAVQGFFEKWLDINDTISVEFVPRKTWEENRGQILKSSDGKKFLYLPRDLQLWEIIGVIEAIDRDTFAHDPEKQKRNKEKIINLGNLLINSAIYIARRIDSIEEGKEFAQALAEEFYRYGILLVTGKEPEGQIKIEDLKEIDLTEEQTKEVDMFLAGKELYTRIKERTERNQEDEEKLRVRKLSQFFRIMQKAFSRQQRKEGKVAKERKEPEEKRKPWESKTPIHDAFLERVEQAIERTIKKPERELLLSVFLRGTEKLLREMKAPQSIRGAKKLLLIIMNKLFKMGGINLPQIQETLYDVLEIPKLKQELEEVRKRGDKNEIAAKEREIADKIQEKVSSYEYQLESNNPKEMIINNALNCVGASILAGRFMEEVGLKYLVGDLPNHSFLFLITEDGKLELRDCTPGGKRTIELNEKNIEGATLKEIIDVSKSSSPENYKTFYIKGIKTPINVLPPSYGQMIQVLNNIGVSLARIGEYEKAVETYKKIIELNHKNSRTYYNIGASLINLGRYEEAIEVYKRAIKLNPNDYNSYYGMGFSLSKLGRYEEAIEVYKRAIGLNPELKSRLEPVIKNLEKMIANKS